MREGSEYSVGLSVVLRGVSYIEVFVNAVLFLASWGSYCLFGVWLDIIIIFTFVKRGDCIWGVVFYCSEVYARSKDGRDGFLVSGIIF